MRLAFFFCLFLSTLSFWGFVAFLVIYFSNLAQVQNGYAAAICGGSILAFALIGLLAHRWSER
jgi:hypothetical protein